MSDIEWTDMTTGVGIYGCTAVSRACRHCYAANMAVRLATMPHTAERYAGVAKRVHGRAAWTGKIRVSRELLDASMDKLPKRRKRCAECDGTGIVDCWQGPATELPTGRECPECGGVGSRNWRVFPGSMTDLFHEDVPFVHLYRVFEHFRSRPHIDFQVLTKRPERMCAFVRWARDGWMALEPGEAEHMSGRRWTWPENVWAGCTVENQETAEARVPYLLRVPAAVRFLSCEPLTGPLDLGMIAHRMNDTPGALNALTGEWWPATGDPGEERDGRCWASDGALIEPGDEDTSEGVHWVITGGESGHDAEPSHPAWFRSLRDECADAGVPFLFKQWGAWAPRVRPSHPADRRKPYRLPHDNGRYMCRVGKAAAGRTLDHAIHNEFPDNSGARRHA